MKVRLSSPEVCPFLVRAVRFTCLGGSALLGGLSIHLRRRVAWACVVLQPAFVLFVCVRTVQALVLLPCSRYFPPRGDGLFVKYGLSPPQFLQCISKSVDARRFGRQRGTQDPVRSLGNEEPMWWRCDLELYRRRDAAL